MPVCIDGSLWPMRSFNPLAWKLLRWLFHARVSVIWSDGISLQPECNNAYSYIQIYFNHDVFIKILTNVLPVLYIYSYSCYFMLYIFCWNIIFVDLSCVGIFFYWWRTKLNLLGLTNFLWTRSVEQGSLYIAGHWFLAQ